MEKNKSTHGGYRSGAGRKPTGRKKITTTLTFSPEVLAFLRTKGRGQSEYVERLIKQDSGISTPERIVTEEFCRLLADREYSNATTWVGLRKDYEVLRNDFQMLQSLVRSMIR